MSRLGNDSHLSNNKKIRILNVRDQITNSNDDFISSSDRNTIQYVFLAHVGDLYIITLLSFHTT